MSHASNNSKKRVDRLAWAHAAAAIIIVVAGLWLVPGTLRAEWVDPFEAPPGLNFTSRPIFTNDVWQTKPASLSIGGNFTVGANGSSTQACINDVCFTTLLDALASTASVNYLNLSPATPDTGPVTIFGNNTLYHWNCVSETPCPLPAVEPNSPANLNIINFTIHRSQPPLQLYVNYIENYVCSNNTSLACKTNATCGGSPNTCGFRTVCQNNPTVYCTSSAQCGGQPCITQGMLGNTFTLVFTMTDGSTRTVNWPGATNSASPAGQQADELIVSTAGAKIDPTLPNNQTFNGITLDNKGPDKTITIASIQATWTPPASSPSVPLRSVIVGTVPPPISYPSVVPAFVAKASAFFGEVAGIKAYASTATPPYETYGVWALHREIGGAAVLAHHNLGNTAGEFRGQVGITGTSGGLTLLSKDKLGAGVGSLTPANLKLASGDLRLTNTAGLNDICLYVKSVCSNNANQVCTQQSDCGVGNQCVGECINEWADIRTLYGTTGPSRWAHYLGDEYKTYLKRMTDNQKVNIGGREQDKNSEFVFNQAASKLVAGIPTDPGASLQNAQFKLTCGDGACNGIEVCGNSDTLPACTTDCGQCVTDVTPPTAPPNFREYQPAEGLTVYMAWDAATDNVGVTGYRVYRCSSTDANTTCPPYPLGSIRYDGPNLAYDDTGLSNNITYRYKVVAYDAALNISPPSAATIQERFTRGSGGSCFLAGTPVLMADGSTKAIETIAAGETIMAYDEATGELNTDVVTQTFVRPNDGYILINGRLKVAPPHLFLAEGKWIDAADLRVGNSLRTASGQTDIIRSLQTFGGTHDVYNLEVATDHTYIVDGYVVHNKVIQE